MVYYINIRNNKLKSKSYMKTQIKINGMSCQHCVMAVKKELQKLNLQNFEVKIGEALIEFDELNVDIEMIKVAIEEAGFAIVE